MALFVDLVVLSNGLHGSVQMDSVALFSWIGWLRNHGILIQGRVLCMFICTLMLLLCLMALVELLKIALIIIEKCKRH